ncbi:methyl-accepting chemotaxis protein [Gorillibacterium timonense]|uniref:methyl-accepting chemotaxis protein n=1 Tax=Gorillibacterium timonense TaxID=1689269 RepID=UPI00071E3E32|nr:methyl-accepting chemotaxis protein [Gorillibacterium timonense]
MRSIRTKIFTLTCLVVLSTTLLLTSLSMLQIRAGNERSLQELSKTLTDDYDEMIRGQVETAISMLQTSYDVSVKKGLSKEEASKDAAELLRKLTYGANGYFWADTTTGVNVVLRGTDTEGKNRWDAADTKGGKYIQAILEAAINGGGYSDYWFPKPGETEAKQKRAYSQVFAPLGWVIGTGNYVDDINSILDAKRQELNQKLLHDELLLSGASLLILMIAGFVAYLIGGRIVKPIKVMTAAIQDMGKLKFHSLASLTALRRYRDETGTMAGSLEDMSTSLGNMVRKINNVTMELSANAEELSASASENKQAVGQVATTINEMAEGNEHQAADASRTNEVLHEFGGHVEQIYQQTSDGASFAKGTLAAVKEGRQLLEKQNEQARENLIITREADESMNELAEMMHQVEEIIGLIRSIADQTHLLSLNAAIEAARAGSEGRGFAVVSHEIRKLAENASKATDEISGHIRSTIERAGTTSGRIRQAHRFVIEQAESLKATDEKFGEIFHSADEIVHSSVQISESLENLREIAQGILERSQNQAAAAEESAAAMQEISASAEEQAASHENLVNAAGQLAVMAEQLAEEMGKFEV